MKTKVEKIFENLNGDQAADICLVMSYMLEWQQTRKLEYLEKARLYLNILIENERMKGAVYIADNAPIYSVLIAKEDEDGGNKKTPGGTN